MENRRGRRLALFTLVVLPIVADANCPILPVERDLDFRLVQDRRAVELRRRRDPQALAPVCTLLLNCRVRDESPAGVSYVLRRDSILPGDIIAMRFSFSDGAEQACAVREIQAP